MSNAVVGGICCCDDALNGIAVSN
eukprot:SAG31_NODE_40126_length_283_cov_0.657609_1_plen_23_part_10